MSKPIQQLLDLGIEIDDGPKRCRRCNRKLTSKAKEKGIGAVCERHEASGIAFLSGVRKRRARK